MRNGRLRDNDHTFSLVQFRPRFGKHSYEALRGRRKRILQSLKAAIQTRYIRYRSIEKCSSSFFSLITLLSQTRRMHALSFCS